MISEKTHVNLTIGTVCTVLIATGGGIWKVSAWASEVEQTQKQVETIVSAQQAEAQENRKLRLAVAKLITELRVREVVTETDAPAEAAHDEEE